MEKKKIAIIGAGNMGGAIVCGLLKSGYINPDGILVTDRKSSILDEMKSKGVAVSDNNLDAARFADMIIVAVKPYHYKSVIHEIKPELNSGKMLISIVAGINLDQLQLEAGAEVPVFRVMPNTAIALQESLTCISANAKSEPMIHPVSELFDHLGKTIIIPEELMAAATVLSSCGIAFALRYIRATMQGGIEMGFNADMAQFITAQTIKGATELVLQSGNHPEREIDKVTTPRGITITGLNEMEHKGFSSALIRGLMTSFKKIDNKLL
jgi:pyrroline-5-carboxylate reductase